MAFAGQILVLIGESMLFYMLLSGTFLVQKALFRRAGMGDDGAASARTRPFCRPALLWFVCGGEHSVSVPPRPLSGAFEEFRSVFYMMPVRTVPSLLTSHPRGVKRRGRLLRGVA